MTLAFNVESCLAGESFLFSSYSESIITFDLNFVWSHIVWKVLDIELENVEELVEMKQ